MQPELHHCPGFPTLDTIEAGLIAVIWSSLVITACHGPLWVSRIAATITAEKLWKNSAVTIEFATFTRFPPAPQSGRWCCLSVSAPPSRFPQVLDSIAYICHQHLGPKSYHEGCQLLRDKPWKLTSCESRIALLGIQNKNFWETMGPNHQTSNIKCWHQARHY